MDWSALSEDLSRGYINIDTAINAIVNAFRNTETDATIQTIDTTERPASITYETTSQMFVENTIETTIDATIQTTVHTAITTTFLQEEASTYTKTEEETRTTTQKWISETVNGITTIHVFTDSYTNYIQNIQTV